MSRINNALREMLGLFVDDGSFAAAILVWIAVAWLAMPRLDISPDWQAVFLFAGLAFILIESVRRRARR